MADKARILIVESETPLAMMMVSALTQAGCDAHVAHTGRKGLALARENKFGLIVLAVELSDSNGFEICDELRQRHLSRRTPIILTARELRDHDWQRGQELGAVDYIVKPFDSADFVQRILSAVKSPNALNVSDERADANADSFCDAAQGNQ
ncbi:MAG TPA: response regulator [Alphaproteobacteria bacterium]|nr:response regulator [Alphaproteobacteria bacterium]